MSATETKIKYTKIKYRDGNYAAIPDGEVVLLEEGQQPWMLDAEGNELRDGDHALVLPSLDDWAGGWIGSVVHVTRVGSYNVYEARGDRCGPRVLGAIWPTGDHAVSVQRQTYPKHSTWAISPKHLRRVDLDSAEGKRLLLSELFAQRSRIDEQAARVESDRVRLSLQIRRVREDLGEV